MKWTVIKTNRVTDWSSSTAKYWNTVLPLPVSEPSISNNKHAKTCTGPQAYCCHGLNAGYTTVWSGPWTIRLHSQFHKQQVAALILRVCDRPARCGTSRPPCRTRMSTFSVINWWPRPSTVYHTDRPPRLTAPETISRSRDMVGGWCLLKFKLFTWSNHTPLMDGLSSLG